MKERNILYCVGTESVQVERYSKRGFTVHSISGFYARYAQTITYNACNIKEVNYALSKQEILDAYFKSTVLRCFNKVLLARMFANSLQTSHLNSHSQLRHEFPVYTVEFDMVYDNLLLKNLTFTYEGDNYNAEVLTVPNRDFFVDHPVCVPIFAEVSVKTFGINENDFNTQVENNLCFCAVS